MPLQLLSFLLLGVPAAAAAPDGWPPAPPLVVEEVEELGPLPASVAAEPAGAGRWRCTFRYLPQRGEEAVFLAGSFNGWRPDALRMRAGGGGNGELVAEVELGGGEHAYKLVVDGRWVPDPRNPASVPDNHGGRNSVLRLGRAAHLDPSGAALGDGRVEAAALEHDPCAQLYLQRGADERVVVRLRSLAGDVEGVALVLRGQEPRDMARVLSGPRFDYWEAQVPAPEEPVDYAFVVRDGDLAGSLPRAFRLHAARLETPSVPSWAADAVWYQVFPERFRNGDRANDPDPVVPWTADWHAPARFEGRDEQSFFRWYVFARQYGGDIAGLRASLGYLAELGVNALYLNPIFQAEANHKYNATSYLHVDERFGAGDDYAATEAVEDQRDPATWTWSASDRVFLDFLAAAHAKGFKVIVDGVFNHVGTAHPAFRDLRERGEDSPFADWFDVVSFEPFEYRGWAGFGELPVFAKSPDGFACAEVERHVFAVTRRWMDPDGDGDPSDGIDGWRLDVPNEVARPFWARWRRHVKAINPEAYISGEIWERADEWLDGRHFDAVMNYPFARAALAWIGEPPGSARKIGPRELDRRLAELRLAYSSATDLALMNLVDSHDTDRLLSMLANPGRAYDHENRVQDGAPYDESRPGEEAFRRARLVALLQATYVGAPMIYYGDEVGMWGADDPSNRKPMLWKDLEPYARPRENRVDERQLEHYRAVLRLRRAHPALATGAFRTLLADDAQDLWVFEREGAGERVVVALNAADRRAKATLPALAGRALERAFGEGRLGAGGRLELPGISGAVWVERP